MCGLSRQVVSYGSGLSRQFSLYIYSESYIVHNVLCILAECSCPLYNAVILDSPAEMPKVIT